MTNVYRSGDFPATLSACFDNLQELPVPQAYLKNLENANRPIDEQPTFRLPPRIQALYLEYERYIEKIRNFPPTESLLEHHILNQEKDLLANIILTLILRMLPPERFATFTGYIIGPNWMVHLYK